MQRTKNLASQPRLSSLLARESQLLLFLLTGQGKPKEKRKKTKKILRELNKIARTNSQKTQQKEQNKENPPNSKKQTNTTFWLLQQLLLLQLLLLQLPSQLLPLCGCLGFGASKLLLEKGRLCKSFGFVFHLGSSMAFSRVF